MKRLRLHLTGLLVLVPLALTLAACDPMAPGAATPVAVVVSPVPSATPTPRPTLPPTATFTPVPTPTEVLLPSPTPFPCDDEAGRIEEFTRFPSEVASGENLRYRVYLPPCYVETGRRFPVVYLFHGLSYREQQWEDIGAIRELDRGIRLGIYPPMILVMPYFGTLGQFNTFPPDPSYESHILDELMPAIEGGLCTVEDRAYRAIGGISRGGFWAYSIGFRHPDVFGTIGGHSAFFPADLREVPAAFNPLEIASNSAILPEAGLRLYLDNGAEDSAASSQRNMHDRLVERGIDHTYDIATVGEHNNDYWSAHVSEYLAFYGAEWPRRYEDLPSCRSTS